MADVPSVSVLMPVYNGEEYLGEAIESILNQTFRDFEFIIINDGSTDHSAEIVQSYDDPRIRYFESEQNMGLARSLNRGLALARSPYITRMDQDDISLPERLAKQVDSLNAHPEVGVLGCAVQLIDAGGKLSNIQRYPAEHGVLRWHLCFKSPIAHPTVMMRREVVARVGGYSIDIVHAEDYDLWRRLSWVTHLSNLEEVLLCYRRHETTIESLHHVEQRRNGLRVSQLMMSAVLGEDVPIHAIQCLRSREFGTPNDVRQAAELVHRLFQTFATDSTLSTAEKRTIRRDAASRLCRLVSMRMGDSLTMRDASVRRVLALAWQLDPLVVGRAAIRKSLRIARNRLVS